jgi:hypothetical protein
MDETYFLQNWFPRWNPIVTQLRFIHKWVITGIQWMVHFVGALVHLWLALVFVVAVFSLSNTKSVPSKWNCQRRPAQIPPSQKAKKKSYPPTKYSRTKPQKPALHFHELSSAFWGRYRMHDHYYYYLHCMISNKLRIPWFQTHFSLFPY